MFYHISIINKSDLKKQQYVVIIVIKYFTNKKRI